MIFAAFHEGDQRYNEFSIEVAAKYGYDNYDDRWVVSEGHGPSASAARRPSHVVMRWGHVPRPSDTERNRYLIGTRLKYMM